MFTILLVVNYCYHKSLCNSLFAETGMAELPHKHQYYGRAVAWHAKVFSYLWVMVCYITSIYRYYTTEFNWNFNVVTMKQKEPLSKFDKWWMGKPMCIEGTYV